MKRILFICTGNAGRSQIAAALFARLSSVEILSAGVEPWDDLHPVGKQLLLERGFRVEGLYPKHVDTFAETALDVVVTIGDRAGAETPRFRGSPVRIHWEIPDPADADGSGREEAVFCHTWAAIEARLPGLHTIVEALPERDDLYLAPGISTCIFRPNHFDPVVHVPLIAAAGFTCMELCLFFGSQDFAWDSAKAIRTLRQVASDHGIRIYSVHAAAGLGCMNMGFSREMAKHLIKAHTELACELGATVVPMHAGPDPSLESDLARRQLREDLNELAAFARERPCRLAWENEPRGLTTAEHLSWLRELDPASFSFILDPGHSNIAKTADAYLDHCHDLLCSLHINDNDGIADLHRFPGAGSIEWAGFLGRLERCRYVGPLMLEVQANDRQHELPTVLREARETLEFIRASS